MKRFAWGVLAVAALTMNLTWAPAAEAGNTQTHKTNPYRHMNIGGLNYGSWTWARQNNTTLSRKTTSQGVIFYRCR